MIQLKNDCLLFRTSGGDFIPCSAEAVAIELMGEGSSFLDPDVVHQAASAVIHYFRDELARTSVSVPEFSEALVRVLRGLGIAVVVGDQEASPPKAPARAVDVDLRQLASLSGQGFELTFFPLLREELRSLLRRAPGPIRCRGLRGCVKQLLGARRWGCRCQELNDRIVDYMRECVELDALETHGPLVVR
jgi:hypothetical protein